MDLHNCISLYIITYMLALLSYYVRVHDFGVHAQNLGCHVNNIVACLCCVLLMPSRVCYIYTDRGRKVTTSHRMM